MYLRIFLFTVSVPWYLMSVFLFINTLVSVSTWVKGTGKVVGHQNSSDEGHEICVAVIEYQRQDNSTDKFTSRQTATPCPYEIGEQLPILYSGSKRNSALINTGKELWFSASMGFLIATISLLLGIFYPRIKRFYKRPMW
jgi:hypothetical protein